MNDFSGDTANLARQKYLDTRGLGNCEIELRYADDFGQRTAS